MNSRVLIVDDDADARALCRQILQQEGYDVSEACDGLEALAEVGYALPDVIVMDTLMPNLNGLECARQLKTDPATREVPIIMVSARTEAEDIEAGLGAGVDEYIVKPFRHREFALRVRSMARLYQSRRELTRSNEVRGEQARALGILLELSRSVAAARSLDTIVERIVATAAELTVSRRVSIMLPDREGRYLTVAGALGIDEETVATVRVPIGGAIAGQVFLSGERIVVNTPDEQGPHAEGYDSAFFASAPLISGALSAADRVIGVLNITERCGGRPFDESELEYVDLLCNTAGSAVDEFMTHRARDEARDSIVAALATLAEYRDIDTGRHLDRVISYATILAEELRKVETFRVEIDDQFLQDLLRAMPLHDVGKVAIPDHILLKPGKLTPAETTIMRRHVETGAETLRSVMMRAPGAHFLKMAEQIAGSHHEWYDGSGYPQGLRGKDIPLAARIAAIADVYDALTTKRLYKSAMSHDSAVQVIRQAGGSQFDPAVVEAFVTRGADFARLAVELADEPASPAETDSPPGLQGTSAIDGLAAAPVPAQN
jgi:response regulator RpfG family c-di-GMP phosphodiesterase